MVRRFFCPILRPNRIAGQRHARRATNFSARLSFIHQSCPRFRALQQIEHSEEKTESDALTESAVKAQVEFVADCRIISENFGNLAASPTIGQVMKSLLITALDRLQFGMNDG